MVMKEKNKFEKFQRFYAMKCVRV